MDRVCGSKMSSRGHQHASVAAQQTSETCGILKDFA